MKNAVAVLRKNDHVVPGLLQELTVLAVLADGVSPAFLWLTLPPIGGRQGEQQPGEQDTDPHCPGGFLGWMLQPPLRLALLASAVLDETAVIIGIERLQGLVHRGIGQEDGFARRA
jgi:hypothetical protein